MKLYGLEDYEIFSYNTNIYVLYNQLFVDGSSYGRDLLQTLIENSTDEKKIKKIKNNYSHIILCFDLDPQDGQYSKEKIIDLSLFFNESTDNGKLYINYPMVESFSHRHGIGDNEYIKREVSYSDLMQYKQIVNRFTSDPSKLMNDVKVMNQIIL